METNYPAVICQGKQRRGRGGPGQAGDKQPSQATLFMAFLCISVFIWTFLSWRAGLWPSRTPQHLHGVGCHRWQVICPRAPGHRATGTRGVGVCVPAHVPWGLSGAPASGMEVRCWMCKRWAGQGELLVPAGGGGCGGPRGERWAGEALGRTGGWRSLGALPEPAIPTLPWFPALAAGCPLHRPPGYEPPSLLCPYSPLPARAMPF